MQLAPAPLSHQVPFDILMAAEFQHFAEGVLSMAKQLNNSPADVQRILAEAIVSWAHQELDFIKVNT